MIAKNKEGSPDAIHSDWSVRALAEAFRSVQQQLQQVQQQQQQQLQQVLQQLHQQQQRERQQRQQQPQRQQQQQQQRHQTLSGAATVAGGRHKGPTLRGESTSPTTKQESTVWLLTLQDDFVQVLGRKKTRDQRREAKALSLAT
ncbi:hypothetical protein NOK12_39340 [Nocardioides sp. OK12]|nr:hypothetical protein NOK12_39340 [Nocardioides sp. OK12]